jgi:chitinase
VARWLFLLFLIGVTAAGRAQSVIAYYSGNAAGIEQYSIDKLTHIIFSFCHLRGNRLHVGSRADSLTIKKLVSLKANHPTLKVLLALGGWGGCKTCSGVFSTDNGRLEFATSVLELTNYFHSDGIDLDWEFPVLAAYPGHPFSPADKENLTALVAALKRILGPTKEVSLTAAGFSPYLEGSVDWLGVAGIADRIQLMTYDMIGSRNTLTGHHTPLYSTLWQRESADRSVRYLDSLGVPLRKVAIGVAFYAREFAGVDEKDHGLHQPGSFRRFVSMKQLRKQATAANGYHTYWDAAAQAPYSYNADRKLFLTYDNERSITAKARYVLDKQLNGILFWELRLDRPRDGLLDAVYKGLHE